MLVNEKKGRPLTETEFWRQEEIDILFFFFLFFFFFFKTAASIVQSIDILACLYCFGLRRNGVVLVCMSVCVCKSMKYLWISKYS